MLKNKIKVLAKAVLYSFAIFGFFCASILTFSWINLYLNLHWASQPAVHFAGKPSPLHEIVYNIEAQNVKHAEVSSKNISVDLKNGETLSSPLMNKEYITKLLKDGNVNFKVLPSK